MLILEVDNGLCLRSMKPDDAAAMTDCINANFDHLQKWIPWINPLSHDGMILDFIHEQIMAQEVQEGLMLGLFLEEEPIGMAGLQHWDHSLAMAELGFWLSKHHLQKGLMAKAISKLMHFGFADMQLQRIMATFPITNIRAQRLLERLGFKVEGVLRHEMLHQGVRTHKVVMGMLSGEWAR